MWLPGCRRGSQSATSPGVRPPVPQSARTDLSTEQLSAGQSAPQTGEELPAPTATSRDEDDQGREERHQSGVAEQSARGGATLLIRSIFVTTARWEDGIMHLIGDATPELLPGHEQRRKVTAADRTRGRHALTAGDSGPSAPLPTCVTPARTHQVDRLESTQIGDRLPRSSGALQEEQRHSSEETRHEQPQGVEGRRPPRSSAERHPSGGAAACPVLSGGQPHTVGDQDLGTRGEQHAPPEPLGAPAQVEIGTHVAEEPFPATEIRDQACLHERASSGDREDVSPLVELTLVLRARGGIVDDATR